ncbi:MAG TPA: NAD(P)-binding protein [Steroidobacteraceae bacterium]|nr:NAD(P)-binding protein [Steroidobacteraceae bacterium]
MNIVVLGTGMAGYGAAYHLNGAGFRPVIYDQNSYYGGHTASFRDERGFLFDLGPHISFTKDERIQELFAGYVDQHYESVQINLNNYWRGLWITHPVQMHLNGLPIDLRIEIISEFVKEAHGPERRIANYEDWLLASYGRKFAELFPMQYTRKYHTTEAANMSTDWLGPRMYRPSLEELLRGALAPWTPDRHYITHFRYPKNGGFQSYLRDLPRLGELRLEHKVVAIDPKERVVRFANGRATGYDGLVSSVALPDLVPMITGTPQDIIDASQRLACTTCVLVNVGVDRADLSESQMTYFYDQDVCFTRLSFPHMLSATNVPPGCGSIQAEVYFSKKYRPLTQQPADLIEPVIADLRKVGLLREGDKVLSRGARVVKHANVIFDHDRKSALETVHGYLNDIGIAYCGRYGDWGYMWTDESFISGERAAESALSRGRN